MALAVPSAAAADLCYAIADSVDQLVSYNTATMVFSDIGPTGTGSAEASSLDPLTGVLYATNGALLGTVNKSTGVFTAVPGAPASQTCTLPGGGGTVTVNDIDGLSFDPYTNVLYATARDGDGALPDDVLLQLDPATGLVVADAFGAGVSCVRIPTSTGTASGRVDVDDIAIDPTDGRMYGIANSGGVLDRLVRIDKLTGAVTDLGLIGVGDIEGLGFANDGTLYAVDGDAATSGDLWTLVKSNPTSATFVFNFPSHGDYESVDCMTAAPNAITGTVFFDPDIDGVLDPGEPGYEGATARLYLDDGDGIFNPALDTLLESTVSAADGTYGFLTAGAGTFFVDTDYPASYPAGATLTTDNEEQADFAPGGNQTDTGNDFGLVLPAGVLAMDKSSSARGFSVAQGGLITYSLIPRIPGPYLLTGVAVEDFIPAGSAFIPGSATPTQSAGPDPLRWELGDHQPGVPGTVETALCPAVLSAEPVADTYIDQDKANDNDGTNNDVKTRPEAGKKKHSLMRFDVSSIPAGAVVDEARLTVISRTARSNHVVEIREVTTNWTESSATWNDAAGATNDWATPDTTTENPAETDGFVFGVDDYDTTVATPPTLIPVGGDTPVTAVVTDIVTSWLAGTNHGLVLLATGTDNGDANWDSREEGDPARRPRLDVYYRVPSMTGCSGVDTLVTSKDTWIDAKSDQQDKNHGDENRLQTTGKPGEQNNALIWFDLIGIPPGATINSATIQVEVETDHANHIDTVYPVTTAWNEGDGTLPATWDDAETVGGGWASGDFSTADYDSARPIGTFLPTSKGQKTISGATVIQLVDDWVNGALANEGIVLVGGGSATDDVKYYSAEEGTETRRPRLIVDWTLDADQTLNEITALGTLVSDGDTVTVTMTLTSSKADPSVAPGALTVNGTNGASAVCGAASPASQPISAGTPITFEWTCTASATAGQLLGRLTFEADAAGTDVAFANAVSHSVMVVPPLVYTVQVANPLDPNQTTIVNTATATSDQTPPATDITVDPVAKGVIGDRVWLDTDGDGVQDIGEEGIPNVQVTLYSAGLDGIPGNGDDVAVATTVTGAAGQYLFTDLPPGIYYTDVTDATVPAGLTLAPGSVDPSAARTITGGEVFLDLDFGYGPAPGTAVIGDYLWSDADGDGVQDPGEPGIGGVTVNLVGAGPDGILGTADDVIEATTATTADGKYLFAGVAAGEYLVVVDETSPALAGYSVTSGPQSPGDATSPPITVTADDVFLEADFGYFKAGLGSIGTLVWFDEDGDGVFDSGVEAGLEGVSVDLVQDVNGDGVWDPDGADDMFGTADDELVIATALTAADGTYSFDGLVLDDGGGDAAYLVGVSDEAGVVSDMVQTFGALGVDGNGQPNPYAVVLTPGSTTDLTADFAFEPPNVLGDRVWSDANGDGVQDPGEAGIGGVLLNLLDGSGSPVLDALGSPITVVTEPDGSYRFLGVDPGDYLVEVDGSNFGVGQPLEGYLQTGDPDEPGTCATCDGEGASTLGVGDTDLTLDFGYQADTAAVFPIRGTVFLDDDADGFYDEPDEAGFAGVTVELRDSSGNVVATTTTDANGDYEFPDLPDGDYTVAVTDRAGILDGYTLSSGLDAIDVTVAGGPVEDVDFGYVRDPLTASIGDTVWFDADGDGQQGPVEPGIPGVVVDLYEDADGDGVLEPTVEVLDGRIDLDGDGDVDGFDDGELAGIRIIDGRLDLDGDGSITGADDGAFNGATVIDGEIDLNGSGGVDGTDDGTLAGDDGLPLATTLTDGGGRYLFPDLAAGPYFVDLREGTLPDSTADGDPDLVETAYPAGVDPSAVIALSEGERNEDADFGYVPRPGTAAIGDRVWHDTDGDGAQDDGELGIPGVDIIVSGPGGDVTVTTRADGLWLVTGLTAASTTYSVNFDPGTVPAGLTRTFPGDVSYVVTLNDGDLFTHLDYGFTGGSYGQIGTLVWLDLNGDGDVDAGEPPIEDVTVSLIADTNGDGIWDPDGADDLFGTADDEPILETATTDAAGSYLFTGVPLSADYLVDVSDIGGVLADLQKTSGAADTDNNSQDDPYAVSMPGVPTAILTADFGYTPAGGFGSIGNKVWHDLNGDGVRDPGEPGIEGVTLDLWLDVDDDGIITPGIDNLVRSTTTDTSGEYEFKSLPFGDYLVNVTDKADVLGLSDTPQPLFVKTTGTAGVDDNSQAIPYPVTLAPASPENVTADFGYQANPANPVLTISGTVFEDADNDATFDDGSEAEIQNATVYLFRDLDGDGVLDATDPLIGSVQTDANGDYLFTNLPAGDYLLAVDVDGTPVDDFLQTTQAATGGVQPVTLPTTDPPDPGAPNSTGNDFGFWNGGTLTNPVTLAWFQAEEAGAGVRFEWMTATETGNVGFNLYAVGEAGLRRLNDELIPSPVIDSLEPQRYALDAGDAVEQSFILEDVDLLGVRRYHGPFQRGETRGAEPQPERIPWGEIRAQRAARHAAQQAARRHAAAGLGTRASAGRPLPNPGPRPQQRWPVARLEVTQDGIHRVTYEQLLAAGVDLTGAPVRELALTRDGAPVPLRVEGRGQFGPGGFVEFVGKALETLYTRTSVYTLAVSGRQALPVERDDRPAPPWAEAPAWYLERLPVNRDRRYILTAPGADPWYESHLLAYGGPASGAFDVDIDGYAGGPAALEVELWGLSEFPRDPDHHVELAWNGAPLGDERFDGRVVHRVQAELGSGDLAEGRNTLELTLPGDGGTAWDMVALDRLWVTYPRRFVPRQGRLRFEAAAQAFEIDNMAGGPGVVYRVEGERTVLVGGLRYVGDGDGPGNWIRFAGQRGSAVYHFAANGALLVPGISPAPPPARLPDAARLLVISHADFLEEIQPLVDARRAEGWTVAVVDVAQAYDWFSHGVADPQALRRLIRWAHAERQTEAVLLVGGDTYDYHDNLGLGSISFVPSLYTATDEIVRFAPVDPLYGDVDDDGLPDVSVGRLPVRTPDELAAVVTRILEYDDSPFTGTALMAADAYDVPAGYSFAAASDELAAMLPAGWSLERAYLDELGRTEARERLIGGVNDGVGLTSYFGHSGPSAWSFQNLFSTADAAALENSGRPTVVTQWGCWNTYHVAPTYSTLGHKLLLSGDRGAAAVLGAATLTEAQAEQKLGRLLFARFGRPGETLGGALLGAKRELARAEPDLVDVILGWTLLGDPTMRMDR